MKYIFLYFLSLALCSQLFSQPLPDSILTKYNSAPSQKEKEKCLDNYFINNFSKDSRISNAVEILFYFKKQDDAIAADYTGLYIAGNLGSTGDYTAGLNMALPILSRFEKRNDTLGMNRSFQTLTTCFLVAKNYDQAIVYLKKIIPLAPNKEMLTQALNDIGAVYAQAFMPDSGLVYAQKAVTIDMELNSESNLVNSLSTLAENYIANKDYDLAMPFLRRAIRYSYSIDNPNATAFINNDFAQAFLGSAQYDSANYYARLAIQYYSKVGYKAELLRSYEYLNKSFEKTNQQDSANKYFRLAMITKDSLYSVEKTRVIQSISLGEQLRQQEIDIEKIKAVEERKQNIQYALIALGIITFIILFLLLSRRMITNTKVIEFLGILALLLVFEFLNLLLHPFLERKTNHSTLLMLLALVCIASFLIPAHNTLQKWTTKKLVEKNKAIRLASAKKTIQKLEGKTENMNPTS